MLRSATGFGIAAMLAVATTAALAQQKPIIYPAKGQSTAQQQKDDGECYTWAKSNTGIDPVALAQPAPAQPTNAGKSAVKGAVKGAVGGAVVGEIANDDAGRGAAAGAAAGAVGGGVRAQKAGAAQQQQAQEQQKQQLTTYYRAFSACMEGRGYTLK